MTPSAPTLAIWHGYLLGATGSNIYTNQLVHAWVRAGYDVVLVCQEHRPEQHDRIHEHVRLRLDERGEQVEESRTVIREPAPGEGRCTMVVPDIHGLLPVYVLDRYEGFEVRRLVDLAPVERQRYADAHAAAARWVVREHTPAGVLINHATPLPAALAPVFEPAGVPYAVKVHGSELEYALREDPSLVPAAARALAAASAVLVGSDHIERRTEELAGRACLEGHTVVVPPGVDLDHFVPLPTAGPGADRIAARARLVAELLARVELAPEGRGDAASATVRAAVAEVAGSPERAAGLVDRLRDLQGSYEERHVEATAADQIARIPADARLITFVGKLIPQKGVQLVVAALPDLLVAHPDTHLVIAGFGPLRDALEALLVAMELGDEAAVQAIADGAGALAGEAADALGGLGGFLDSARADGRLTTWLDAARSQRITERVSWLGLVDHALLAHLWPLCETSIVPSILAEAFGMVAAEAAACGCVPIVSDHSGLADAARVIELQDVAPIRVDVAADDPVTALAGVLGARLSLPPHERARQSAAARDNVAAAWSWDEIAARVAALMTAQTVGAATR